MTGDSRVQRPRHRAERLAVNFQALGQRFSFLALLAAACTLLIFGRVDYVPVWRISMFITEVAAPVLDLMARPVQALRSGVIEVDHYLNALSENERLREEVRRLRNWQVTALNLEQENSRLKGLLNTADLPSAHFISGRVIGDATSPFVDTLLINVGARQGVREGMAVVGEGGLLGRIISTGADASRILLLTDLNSKVPVIVEPGGYRAVLSGNNDGLPQLLYLPNNVRINAGDRLVTSGHGGMFPPGVPVGAVSAVWPADRAVAPLVRPFVDNGNTSFVRILRYELPLMREDIAKIGLMGDGTLARDEVAAIDPQIVPRRKPAPVAPQMEVSPHSSGR
ncbi:MAG TPA: rod shape-determining protein MreC [Alphaproteobacteria bacterium]|nr:rod shape-determining protein MreC [Alphaproteobacteria bacterium]